MTNQLTGLSNGAGTVAVPPATFPTSQMDYSDQDWAAGGQVGINKQYGHMVYGVEGDMDALGGHSSQFSSYALPATGLTTGSTVSIDRRTDPNWTASVRGRVGWATGPFLLYGTGGVAIAASVRARSTATPPPPPPAWLRPIRANLGPFAKAPAPTTRWSAGPSAAGPKPRSTSGRHSAPSTVTRTTGRRPRVRRARRRRDRGERAGPLRRRPGAGEGELQVHGRPVLERKTRGREKSALAFFRVWPERPAYI